MVNLILMIINIIKNILRIEQNKQSEANNGITDFSANLWMIFLKKIWKVCFSLLKKFKIFLIGDCSLATIRGHSVLHTLVRAKFSPDFTGKRYIYSGCARGNCFSIIFIITIYN